MAHREAVCCGLSTLSAAVQRGRGGGGSEGTEKAVADRLSVRSRSNTQGAITAGHACRALWWMLLARTPLPSEEGAT